MRPVRSRPIGPQSCTIMSQCALSASRRCDEPIRLRIRRSLWLSQCALSASRRCDPVPFPTRRAKPIWRSQCALSASRRCDVVAAAGGFVAGVVSLNAHLAQAGVATGRASLMCQTGQNSLNAHLAQAGVATSRSERGRRVRERSRLNAHLAQAGVATCGEYHGNRQVQ